MSREKELGNLISKRSLENASDSFELQLERRDWMAIINALSHFAMQEYEEAEDPSLKFGRAISEMPALAKAAGCFIAMKVTEAKK